ncbi:NAD(+) kinase [Desulfonema ishimotonii]|uniref:NAD kinase n=1 Tax=Desulfonema ishimotonii TaxID=45657 RepID=A0A401FR80_9BACT|nr:NAD(+)/NADH kinase [Desulfonema ishimotonii]GBC59465.1 NAD(+) kinase [Desulfonema ishimotonii]
MKKVGLFVKVDEKASRKADDFEDWLMARGIDVIRMESLPPSRKLSDKCIPPAPPDMYCVFVLGGDGTFLSATRWIGGMSVPILGIKFGEVGFLAETAEDNLFSAAETVLSGEFTTMPRMRLSVRVFREGKVIASEPVLNDIVINKGALARLARMKTFINDRYLTTYRADGLIVSTPTGSTAYSLAAGGPVIHPTVPGIVMTPICPFTLTNRPLIVPDSVSIKICLDPDSTDIMLTFDGQAGLEINEKDTIVVRKSARPIHMIAMPDRYYFDVLKTKLQWSGERI